MRNINHNNYEEWLFEYFEGGLSGQEKNQVLEFIQRDPLYQEEFNYWEKTYIREPLPSKLKIEGALLRNQASSDYRPYLSIALLLFMGIASYVYFSKEKTAEIKFTFNQQAIEKPVSPEPQKEIVIIEPQEEKRTPELKNNNVEKKIIKVETKALPTLTHVENKPGKDSAITQPEIAFEPASTSSQNDSIVSADNAKIIDSTPKVQTKPTAAPLTKKEERTRRRYIEKLKEKERIRQLQKGKLPYLVPLDPNTF